MQMLAAVSTLAQWTIAAALVTSLAGTLVLLLALMFDIDRRTRRTSDDRSTPHGARHAP